MSNDSGMRIWVSDIDGYVDIDALDWAYQREMAEDRREAELDSLGDFSLFAGKAISARSLVASGVPPAEWRWAVHCAEQALAGSESRDALERVLLRRLVALGKPYAVRRYTRSESLSHASGMATMLPLGLRALCDQYLAGEGLAVRPEQRELLRQTLHSAERSRDVIAYRRAGLVQATLHRIARELRGPLGGETLMRESTRTILSLARLRFSITELELDTFDDVKELSRAYKTARSTEQLEATRSERAGKRYIARWRVRHLHSLLYFFPRPVRGAMARAAQQSDAAWQQFDHDQAVHELALASALMNAIGNRFRKSAKKNPRTQAWSG